MGRRRRLQPGGLRGGAGALLCRLDAPHGRRLQSRAIVSQPAPAAPILRACRRGGAAVSTIVPAGRARPRLTRRRCSSMRGMRGGGAAVSKSSLVGAILAPAILKAQAKEHIVKVNPYLSFNGTCEAAFKFYEQVFGGKIQVMMTFEGSPMADHAPANWRGKIMHARLDIGDQTLMGSDPPPDRYQPIKG